MADEFPLHSVLELRERREEQLQQELSRAEARLAQAQAAATIAAAERDALAARLADLRTGTRLDPYALVAGEARLARVRAAVAEAQAATLTVALEVEQARTAAVAASQERLTLERLRDRFREERAARAAHAEAERLGELGLTRWVRLAEQ